MNTALFVVAHDSQFKWAFQVASELKLRGWSVSYLAPTEHARISEQQMIDVGIEPSEVTHSVGSESYWFMAKHDAIFFPTPGAITERYIYRIRDLIETGQLVKRPIIVSSYVGLIIDNHVAGFLYRAPADIVCVNSKHDLEIFQSACKELGLEHSNLLLTGLAVIPDIIEPQEQGPINQVVFADQLALPKDLKDKRQIYQLLIEYAVAHPDRTVIIKPRHRPDEGSFHRGKLPPEMFFTPKKMPPNMVLDYTPISELLESTDLMLTLSSTAALEAIAYGVRTAIISDVGVKEIHGNNIFVGSGLIRSFAELARDEIGAPAPEWVEKFQNTGGSSSIAIADAIEHILNEVGPENLALQSCQYFKARRECLLDRHGIYQKPSVKPKSKPKSKKQPFEVRIQKYGPIKRFVVGLGDKILPDAIATRIDRSLQKIGIL